MLSTQAIKNTGQASHYFLAQDNYYTEGGTLSQERSQWWGKGAQTLGLSGVIDPAVFTELLNGKLPNGQQLGKQEGDQIKHRPGFDLTFSAPKSVSLLALMGGDERILLAVERATDKALTLIERDLAKARVTRLGITNYQKTSNLVVARFLHDLSREGDPQLHTHCVMMNMTQRQDGRWRSLASQMGNYGEQVAQTPLGFLEAVRHHKKYYGALFRAELAYEMTQLGYSVVKSQNGFFEISGISPAVIKTYSQRRQDIEAFMQEQHLVGAKAAAVATLKTRQAKKRVNREDLIVNWQAKAELFSVPAFQEIQETVTKALAVEEYTSGEIISSSLVAQRAVLDAMAHLSDTRVALRETEILHQASKHVLSEPVSVTSLLQAVEDLKKSGDLIPLPVVPEYRGEAHFTTATLLHYEKELLQAIAKPHASGKPLISSSHLNTFLSAQMDLTREQRQALMILFSSQQQVLVLEGSAGSGKTHLLKPMMELAKLGGYKPILLTPSKAHSVDLEQQLKSVPSNLREWFQSLFADKKCETVAGFLYRQENVSTLEAKLQKKPLILLENSTLLSSRQLRDVVHHTERLGGRLLMIGDAKSTLTWQAGSPFIQMLAQGVTAAHLRGNQRTKIASLKSAVSDTLQGHIQAAFDKIGQRVFSIENKDERQDLMAAHYVGLMDADKKNKKSEKGEKNEKNEKNKICVLMPTKTACEEINLAIREKLKIRGDIQEQDTTVTVLLPHGMTSVEQRYAKNYSQGQWVRFNGDYFSLRVRRGDYRQITGIDSKQNKITLADVTGRVRQWDPSKVGMGKVEVFEAKTRAIAVGDTLVWRRSDKVHKLYNGAQVTVVDVSERRLKLASNSGKSIALDRRQPSSCHFDYGHAFTPYQKYHAQPDVLIAYQNSFSRQSHQRAFYQLIGQAKKQAWIYTEDKTQLGKNLVRHTGDKMTAMDALLHNTTRNALASDTNPLSAHIRLLENAVQNALDKGQQASTPEGIALTAVQYALAHLSEREAAFTHKDVMKTALQHTLGEVQIAHIEQAVLDAEKNGELIRGIYSQNGTHWTTQEALQRERDIVALAKTDKGQLAGLLVTEQVLHYRQINTLSQEQGDTLSRLATVKDRVVLIQGFAGTRKTTLLQHVQTLLQSQNHDLLCLAPTHTAVKELKARGLEGQTLDHFLTQYRLAKISLHTRPHLIAVDESSMVSNRRLHDFLTSIHELGARTLIMGDTQQYAAIESGKPFAVLQKAGIHTLFLQDITRQEDDTLKAAVKATYQGEFAEVFRLLEKHIIEVGSHFINGQRVDNRTERLEIIRDDYLNRDPEQRSQTLIVTFGNEDRVLQNALIREKLKEQGELFGEACITQVLVARNMSEIERTRVSNYQAGDILRFNLADRPLNIEKDQYWTIQEIHPQKNILVLVREGNTVLWKPRQLSTESGSGVEVYQAAMREIQAGDLIRWTRTDKELHLFSPELAKVIAVQDKEIILREIQSSKGSDKEHRIHITPEERRFQHWDHAYAMTGYSAQGKTISDVIINAESFRPHLTSQPSFLVSVTRAVKKLAIYTDNKQALLEAVIRNRGEKFSALETVAEFPYTDKHPNSKDRVGQVALLPFQKENTPLITNPSVSSSFNPLGNTVDSTNISSQLAASDIASPQKTPSLDAERIYQRLLVEAENVVERLLGEPKVKEGGQYRYGSHQGSLIVTLNGDKRGLWHDFQTGEGGNLFKLIATQRGFDLKQDFKRVLQEALHLVGTSDADVTVRSSTKPFSDPKIATTLTPQQQKSLRYARQLTRESQPLLGTLAERYLREHRQIPLEKFPATLRFHPGIYSKRNDGIYPALLVIAKNSRDKVQAVQAIFLDEKTAQKANLPLKKQTWGMPSQGAVRLNKTTMSSASSHSPTYLAEGVETALSIYAALGGGDVRITLGKSNFKNIDPKHAAQQVVLCLDNDGNSSDSDKLIHFAAENLRHQGKQVWITKPKENGQDYNDVLKQQGLETVKKEINHAIPYQNYFEQKATDVTLKSVVLDKHHLLLDDLKLPNEETENLHKKDRIQPFIHAENALDLSGAGNKTTNISSPHLEKTLHKNTLSDDLSMVPTKNSTTFTVPESQSKEIEKIKKIEKEREPEF